MQKQEKTKKSVYLPQTEWDSCGFGLMANMDGDAGHRIIETSIHALERLTHRGAVAADKKSGDGCGLLMKMPEPFIRKLAAKENIKLPPGNRIAVGMVFLNQDEKLAAKARAEIEKQLEAVQLKPCGWRVVPTNPKDACGKIALKALPRIEQIFITRPDSRTELSFEQRLFTARRRTDIALKGDPLYYMASMSSRLLSYKGLVMPNNLAVFYPDLQNKELETSICIFHQRFSTNTSPKWPLAQPLRMLAHNGEINTLLGNRNWAKSRVPLLQPEGLPPLEELAPLVSMTSSDSCSLDNMLELLVIGGISLVKAVRMLVPPAWQNIGNFDPDLRAFYEYNSMHNEPWDGPAGIVLSDGRYAVCAMDRNGLRPARYVVTKDRMITLASEIGVYDYEPSDVVMKGHLGSGEIIAVDTETGRLLKSHDIDNELKSRQPYRKWLEKRTTFLTTSLPDYTDTFEPWESTECRRYQKMFGVSFEECDQVIRVLAEQGVEATGSMGDDTPIPILSTQRRLLYDSFRQQFAQVTNPPIDSLREQMVMSLETYLGRQQNVFEEHAEYAERIVLSSPIVSDREMKAIKENIKDDHSYCEFDLNTDNPNLKEAITNLCDDVLESIRERHAQCIVLSDRHIDHGKTPIHALLACGAVNQRLIQEGERCKVNLIIDTGTARDSHQCAVLIAYGATAVNPYVGFQTLADMKRSGVADAATSLDDMFVKYVQGLNKGLFKIMSKMGISTISSYRNSQLFEIIGLNDEVVNLCFKHTVSRVSGIGFEQLQKQQEEMAFDAMNDLKPIAQTGLLKYIHGGERHAYNPEVVQSLRKASQSGERADYDEFAKMVNEREPIVLRDLLDLRSDKKPIDVSEVEPIEQILPRFDSAGMSLGALSPDAHETLAEAMNQIGGYSNSGEGGEGRERYGTNKRSRIKQIASGRFGVTTNYLVHADVIQIKIAQGAKPGEGGQLPGHKVNKMIASLRHSSEGVTLISPPPHHDIYSIEDLAQLIFDLKQVNPTAQVSVKLVSEPGVGTVAVGVAKAYADMITISGYDGGTGASPVTSIKYAGVPWELGVPEAHLALRANHLRSKIRLQADGGLKTGLDVIKAAVLGAESFGFGTAPMIAMGCKYLRICHLNNCATGVATQNEILRHRHFIGKADMVINYFRGVATEVRELMAQLGVSKFEDLVGQTHYLTPREDMTEQQKLLDLHPILADIRPIDDEVEEPHIWNGVGNPSFDKAELAQQMLKDTADAIANKTGGEFEYKINNTNRSIGTLLAGEIARHHGEAGIKDTPIKVRCVGTAGQSFGAWTPPGLHLELIGDANDYVGKGMAGGEIIITQSPDQHTASNETSIVGNTCLYGATGGDFYAAGLAGGRFATRNSGAMAIVEGIGDHGCEYMTGGVVVVLGRSGMNFGAAMTGGFAIVLDKDRDFNDRFNHGTIETQRMDTEDTFAQRKLLHMLIARYCEKTNSAWGRQVLDDLSAYIPLFWLVKPKDRELSSLAVSLSAA